MSTLFIVGSRGIPADYGGFETFADELATSLAARERSVYVTCEILPGESKGPSTYQGVNLLYVTVPSGNVRTIVADIQALWQCHRVAESGDVVYLLGYGVGLFAWPILKALQAKGVAVWLNPDGIEWKRSHWSWGARLYLRFCSKVLPPQVDRLICDSESIKAHHLETSGVPPSCTDVIEYGAPVVRDDDLPSDVRALREQYLARYDLSLGEYYIQVGRLVPENNLELMVRGLIEAQVDRPLLVISNRDSHNGLYRKLHDILETEGALGKVIFAGTVYDRPLLQALRLGAYAHLHGHEVGGTNPALVEAMGLGNLILSLNTRFNREVLGRAGLYFGKSVASFVQTLHHAERLSSNDAQTLKERAVDRVRSYYNWPRIVDEYERRIWGTVRRSSTTSSMKATQGVRDSSPQ